MNNSKIVSQKSIKSIEQQIVEDEHTYLYVWEIEMTNDSISKVNVYISEPGRNMVNKIIIPFVEAEIEYDAKKYVHEFYKRIKEHLDNIKINVVGISEIDSVFCIYTSVTTTQIGKAKGMMNNYPMLTSFIAEHGLEPKGLPIVEITEWNMERDSIKYNFCFPILELDSLPKYRLIKYKWLENTKALKAVYNGNYITSDRAWYELMSYARKRGIEVKKTPIEIYHNNPNLGGNEGEWRADIYLPIK